MTVLAALARYYDRLAEQQIKDLPPFGYASTSVGFCVVLKADGSPAFAPVDRRQVIGRKAIGERMNLPTPLVQRTSGISPNFLWDKTAYSLGITAGNNKRTSEEHKAFCESHAKLLCDSADAGLKAFLRFLETWTPDQFAALGWPEEMKDENIVFALADEYRDVMLHQRPEAISLWIQMIKEEAASSSVCLVTGDFGRIARSHPPIKGVWDAQSFGAFIISYNATAFESYGHKEGDNAPVGEPAAFAYTTALNRLLAPGSRHRVQIGDASTVFWAVADDPAQAEIAEQSIGALLGLPAVDEEIEAAKIGPILDAIAKGRAREDLDPRLTEGVRFYVLGLSPNAARLSVRFWFEDSFGAFADRLGQHARDMALDPPPREARPTVGRLLIEAAVLRKRENVPPQLAGEFLRAILSGGRYPATLLSTLLMRLRADGSVSALRVAMLKAIVARSRRLDALDKSRPAKEEPPVSLNLDCNDPGYLLGRLFAVYEQAQFAALGNINASIRDKFFGAAGSTPQTVFPLLQRGAMPHLAKVRKERPGQAVNIEKEIAAIMERFDPEKDPFPRALPPEQQALFALGYYHQRNRHFAGKSEIADAEANPKADAEEEAA